MKNLNVPKLLKIIFSVILAGECIALVAMVVSHFLTHSRFEDLTKENATTFLTANYNSAGILPQGYVNRELTTPAGELRLLYSYDSLEDLQKAAAKELGLNMDALTTELFDYYAIARPTTCTERSCDAVLSFKRQFLDYYEEVTEEDGQTITADVARLNTRDPKIADFLMRAISVFLDNPSGAHGNIYSYTFEDLSDKFLLTVNYVDAGINVLGNRSTALFAINLYRQYYTANKSDGLIQVVPTKTGTIDYLKSLPITEAEFNSLPGHGEDQGKS